jgi:hypothetical protein
VLIEIKAVPLVIVAVPMGVVPSRKTTEPVGVPPVVVKLLISVSGLFRKTGLGVAFRDTPVRRPITSTDWGISLAAA